MKILQDVNKFRQQSASFRQIDIKSEADYEENAVIKALTMFIKKVHSNYLKSDQIKK